MCLASEVGMVVRSIRSVVAYRQSIRVPNESSQILNQARRLHSANLTGDAGGFVGVPLGLEIQARVSEGGR